MLLKRKSHKIGSIVDFHRSGFLQGIYTQRHHMDNVANRVKLLLASNLFNVFSNFDLNSYYYVINGA